MVCFVQGKVKKCLIALPSPLIMKIIYPIEDTIILNQNFVQADNNGIDDLRCRSRAGMSCN